MLKRLLVTTLALVLMGGAGLATAQRTFVVVPKAMNNPFFDLARDGCMQAASELAGVECEYLGPSETTDADQIQIVNDLITRGVDGMAVAVINAPAMAPVLRRAMAAGIKVVTFDADVLTEDSDARISYIGTNNYTIGVELANLTKSLKPNGGTICIMSGTPAAANLNERMKGVRDVLSGKVATNQTGDELMGAGGWTEVDGCPLYTNDDSPLAVQQMGDIMAKYPDLTALVAVGGWPQFVPAAYRQIADQHKDRIMNIDTALVIADTLPSQMEILDDKLGHGNVGQKPYDMGLRSIRALNALMDGESIDDPIYTGVDVCTLETGSGCLKN